MSQPRRVVTVVHRWAGITAGIVAVYFALSGLGMLFKPELEPVVDRALQQPHACVMPVPLAEQVARARIAHPAGAVRRLELAAGGRGVTIVRHSDMQGVYVDACSGKVLGTQARWGGVFGTIEKLHRLRFLDSADLAEGISGSLSIVLATVLACAGLYLWWPRSWSHFKSGLTVPLGLPGHAFDMRMHRTIGGYAAIAIMASAMAAWPMVFDWARNAVYGLAHSPPPAPGPKLAQDRAALASPDVLLASVLAAAPRADSITFTYPAKPRDPVEAIVIEQGGHPYARTMVWLQPETGRVLRHEPYETSPAGHKVYRWLSAFHTGTTGSWALKLLLLFGIGAIPVLAFTGTRSWLRRRLRKPALPRGQR